MALRFVQLGDVLDDPDIVEALRSFNCGDEPWARRLNDYLRNKIARRDELAQVITAHLVFTEDGHLAGYVSLACSRIDTSQALRQRQGLRHVPYASLPALLITHFAIQCSSKRGASAER